MRAKHVKYLLGNIPFLLLCALFGGVALQIFGPRHRHICDQLEFPLSGIHKTVVIDNEDQIHVGLGFYSRVQVYDPEGNFLHGYFTVVGGPSRLGRSPTGRLEIATIRGDRIYSYDQNGDVAEVRMGGRQKYEEWDAQQAWSRDSLGRLYQVRGVGFSPCIVQIDNGHETVVVRSPFYLWPFVAPAPCLVLLVASAMLWKFYASKTTPAESDATKT